MRFLVALVVFTFGLGLYAVAALLFDRRGVLRGWHAARRAQAAGEASEAAEAMSRAPRVVRAVSTFPPATMIVGSLVVGTILMLGSCAGLILW
ncbi:hypothetical protein HC028_20810 [Planosporangium flavigriseum]|uniref:Uncharacterized protein n=1 Tax=Planosporangium flavigriseum TaxID=373681 RepID=A0A8J3LZN7_9ACTN|nr:hypothetical protein [Planosporangium flavigriseum]NJC66928.1 hypothetical protein [Planosporangium flavigriseum]GIG74010.1 hypothetical protein Pfl04_24140 [Planosporangium flavigriseum]